MTKNSSSSRAHLALNSGTTRRSAKKGGSTAEKHSSHRPNRQLRRVSTGTVRTLSMYCNCGASTVFCTRTHPASVVAHQRACQRPCPRTGRTTSTTCTTGTSTTLSAYDNCGHLSLHNSGHVNNLQELHLERRTICFSREYMARSFFCSASCWYNAMSSVQTVPILFPRELLSW